MANTSSQEKKPNIFVRMGGWLKRSWSEFKKVSWPTFPEVVKNTGVVLVVGYRIHDNSDINRSWPFGAAGTFARSIGNERAGEVVCSAYLFRV